MGPQPTFSTQHATHIMQRATYTHTLSIHSLPGRRRCDKAHSRTRARALPKAQHTHTHTHTHTQRHDAHTRTASRADSGGQCELHSTGGTSRAIIFIDTAASVPEPRPSPVRILTTYAATAGAAKADPRRAELIAAGSARTNGLGDSAVHAIGGGARIIAAGGRKGEGDWEDSPSAESSSRSTASSPRCDGAAASPAATCGASSTALATSGSCKLRVRRIDPKWARRGARWLVGW